MVHLNRRAEIVLSFVELQMGLMCILSSHSFKKKPPIPAAVWSDKQKILFFVVGVFSLR